MNVPARASVAHCACALMGITLSGQRAAEAGAGDRQGVEAGHRAGAVGPQPAENCNWRVFAFGLYGCTDCTSAAHGTTHSISSRNSHLRVLLVDRFRPSSSCFMALIVAHHARSRYADRHGVMPPFPSRHGAGPGRTSTCASSN